MDVQDDDAQRADVRAAYSRVAKGKTGCGAGCGSDDTASLRLGYSEDDLASVPQGADLGLGCGNPRAIAALAPGETVLDLGSGGGFDCFLAAKQVGASGKVIGIDMTPEMISKARANAARVEGAATVEFRLGEIEHLPVADAEVDVILSNCVINHSPDKEAVFREAFRVLKPGGRLAISDLVATQEMPRELRASTEALTGWVAGAATADELRKWLLDAGFEAIRVEPIPGSGQIVAACMPGTEDYFASATLEGIKPVSGVSALNRGEKDATT